MRQLVDLNGDSTNFDITFNASTKDKSPFYAVVVDQTTLDNNPEFQYKLADKGQLSGNIVHDKNIYQNYFLVLKADKPCQCVIEVIKKEIPPAKAENKMFPPMSSSSPSSPLSTTGSSKGKNWLLWGGLIAVGLVAIYFFYFRKGKNKKTKSLDQLIDTSKSGDYKNAYPSPSRDKIDHGEKFFKVGKSPEYSPIKTRVKTPEVSGFSSSPSSESIRSSSSPAGSPNGIVQRLKNIRVE